MPWVQMNNFRCPVASCPSEARFDWVCVADGSPMFLNEFGVISCGNGWHSGNINTWGWNCGNTYHNCGFGRADFEAFSFGLSQAAQMLQQHGAWWFQQLVIHMGYQYGR
ncbi:uncharacterized protein LOC127853221 [Dreissena polymorpha]|uniref:Uncharacterized protein n=1 Tax=Dreissena polymorpha TaxID=45954 RepID=A0A9D4CGQ8_DREPO|nr:uncharacterized protein LOC127853221 [Dreissena polymorpha]XP_052243471.1 uncharacterized protein LOC127853221 [Dreissena polymorpha]KAH3724381.1 hypothetical protein DPMN_050197 [Dreissena polymorpha]